MRVLVAGVLVALLTGCGQGGSQSTGDCSIPIRSAGTVYMEAAGFVRGPAQPVGQADIASCEDTGADARGIYFSDDPEQVEVWSFEGQDSGRVLGVLSGDRYRVFVAEGEDLVETLRTVRRSQRALD